MTRLALFTDSSNDVVYIFNLMETAIPSVANTADLCDVFLCSFEQIQSTLRARFYLSESHHALAHVYFCRFIL